MSSRYKDVKAIRIQKFTGIAPDGKSIKINTLEDLQEYIKLLGKELDLSKALELITKDEFDSMEIPTLSIV